MITKSCHLPWPGGGDTHMRTQTHTHEQSDVASLINVTQQLRPQLSLPNRQMIISALEFIYCGVKIHQYIRRPRGEPLMCTDANVTFNLIGRSRGMIIVISNAPLHQFPRGFFPPNFPSEKLFFCCCYIFFRNTPSRFLVADIRIDSRETTSKTFSNIFIGNVGW